MLAHSQATLSVCAALTEGGPLSSAAKSQGPVFMSCAQGLNNIPFWALSLPKVTESTPCCINYPVSSDKTHRCHGVPWKTIAEVGLTKEYMHLD